MKKLLLALAAVSLVSFSSPSLAAPRKAVDVAAITCAQVMNNADNTEAMGVLLGWLDGYTSAKSGSTQISPPWMAKLGLRITGYCAKHPDGKIMDALKTMLP